ncbi:probetacellulin isoform X2 [Cynoglossus semilaevis]|uniref:probetacellulin isoform X2 n=1 Tax=Cynoglossus semilaevis TaxID=244447 RepID=UPI000D627E6A|nr:probetacellulin-like isoform X2 [Cynoglossus semilaevis]
MAKMYRLCIGIITALAFCKYCLAEGNTTVESTNRTVDHCHQNGSRDNCTEPWSGHFSECPQQFEFYCVHGDCRYVKDQETPSCRCHHGFIGSRCEYVDLGFLRGEKRHIIIACIVTGLLLLILLLGFICFCSRRKSRLCWQKRRRREAPTNGSEKLSMMDTRAAHAALTADAKEPPLTDTV